MSHSLHDMNAYMLFCLAVLAIAGFILWCFRPKKCKECGGTGKVMCHQGEDHYFAECFKCHGTGWRC